jgi:UDP-N-acetylglucosamine 2-epimerase (non-hydrolysing)
MSAPIMILVGTRPEVIKMAPVVRALEEAGETPLLVTTGQHREMLQQTLEVFDLTPDVDLALMRSRQTLAELTSRAVDSLDQMLRAYRPRTVLVQGDTTTALCGALAALYGQVSLGHVEAGLRTNDLRDPFPEEANRRLIGQLAALHFCPTPASAQNLMRENVDSARIYVTGNTAVDAALSVAAGLPQVERPADRRRQILVTMHRRETQGKTQHEISRMLARLADRDDIHIIFPLHLSPAVRDAIAPELRRHPHVTLCEPVDYRTMVSHLATVDVVLTDSGGLQEEAPAFDVPVLVMRETTERPEGVNAGCSILCGVDPDQVFKQVTAVLDDQCLYSRMASAPNPYGDGAAARRIAEIVVGAREPAAA